MSQELLERARKIKEKNAQLVGFRGFGYHPDDRILDRRKDGRHVSEGTIDKDLIAFHDRFDAYLVGECAEKAYAVLKDLYERRAHETESYGFPQDERQAILLFPDLKLAEVEGVPHLTVRLGQ